MSHEFDPGCAEYRALSRRQFLQAGAAATALISSMPAWLPQVAYAQSPNSTRDIMVSIYLRGGADGLSLCVPHGDAGYYAAGVRPTLAIPRPDSASAGKAIDLNGFFGFPQAMQALVPAYKAGHLLVVHATGSTDPTRSHFDAQRFMELGKPEDASLHTGWLGRHLASVDPLNKATVLRAVSMSDSIPVTLAGADRTLPLPNLSSFGIEGIARTRQRRTDWLKTAYGRTSGPLAAAAANTINTITTLQKLDFNNYRPGGGAVYPNTGFGRGMAATAALIKADLGVEAIHLDLGGWDTHSDENPINGHMANVMQEFSGALGAFHTDLHAGNVTNVTAIAVSEFGRNVRENASKGTDHGHGNVMFALGEKIKGGQVLSLWPGLQPAKLYQGQDLDVTIDYRDILAEIVWKRLGNTNLPFVFPDYTPTYRNITR